MLTFHTFARLDPQTEYCFILLEMRRGGDLRHPTQNSFMILKLLLTSFKNSFFVRFKLNVQIITQTYFNPFYYRP